MPLFRDSSPYTVLLSDPNNPEEIEEWARKLPDFAWVIATDVSDVSSSGDTIYAYVFKTKESSVWFKLRWS
jgi:hypothetical protein